MNAHRPLSISLSLYLARYAFRRAPALGLRQERAPLSLSFSLLVHINTPVVVARGKLFSCARAFHRSSGRAGLVSLQLAEANFVRTPGQPVIATEDLHRLKQSTNTAAAAAEQLARDFSV